MSKGTGWPASRAMVCNSKTNLVASSAAVVASVADPERGMDKHDTFQIFCGEQDSPQMIIFNEGSHLRIDFGSIKAHHKQLTHLPDAMSASDFPKRKLV